MNSRLKLCLKVAWLTISLTIFLKGMNDCILTNQACLAAGETMFLSMFVISFPISILCVFAALFVLGSDSPNSLSTYLTLWALLTCGGYLQWFVVVPGMFAKRDLTILNLRQEIHQKAPSDEVQVGPARRPRKARPIVAFDRQGRTPLERALGRRS
jgi:hypothetical protein